MNTDNLWKLYIEDLEYNMNNSITLIEELKSLIKEKNDYIEELKAKIQELETIIVFDNGETGYYTVTTYLDLLSNLTIIKPLISKMETTEE